jgi:hypothetical protein
MTNLLNAMLREAGFTGNITMNYIHYYIVFSQYSAHFYLRSLLAQ